MCPAFKATTIYTPLSPTQESEVAPVEHVRNFRFINHNGVERKRNQILISKHRKEVCRGIDRQRFLPEWKLCAAVAKVFTKKKENYASHGTIHWHTTEDADQLTPSDGAGANGYLP